MKSFRTIMFLLLTITFMISSCSTSRNNEGGQLKNYSPVSKDLYDAIAYSDSVLFTAFNSRDLDKLKMFFSEDLEFYHDLGGVSDYKQNMEALRKTFENERKLRRELVAGSLEVYPIKDYGAVETGIHRFYVTEKGQKETLSSEAKFVHVWQKKAAEWKITRIVSYAHQEYLKD